MGMVDSVLKGRDLLIREVRIRYHNADNNAPQFTDRAVRSLVRLFNIDEINWQQDLDRVAKICQETGLRHKMPDVQAFASLAQMPLDSDQPVLVCQCCCFGHHQHCPGSDQSATFTVASEMMPNHTTSSVMPMLYFPEEDNVLDCAGHHLDLEAYQDGFLSATLQLCASMES